MRVESDPRTMARSHETLKKNRAAAAPGISYSYISGLSPSDLRDRIDRLTYFQVNLVKLCSHRAPVYGRPGEIENFRNRRKALGSKTSGGGAHTPSPRLFFDENFCCRNWYVDDIKFLEISL